MDHEELSAKIEAYLDGHWEDIVADIDALVRIPSILEADKAAPGAPFGPGPRESLSAALAMAERMGFEAHDVDGYIGYADFPGATDTQIGIIGHTDVVPAGPGWTFPPFGVARKDGYLVGRGVIDDKGPTVVALHALKFWKDQGERFPYTVRFLFGANEESGMGDVAYYRERFDDPAFLFTPDADFPVCYGEKGCYNAVLRSAPIEDGLILRFGGGAATNAVPGFAEAVVDVDATALVDAEGVTVEPYGEGQAVIKGVGKSAHASLPDRGVNAIGLVVDYLLDHDLCTDAERRFLELQRRLLCCTDGSGLGLQAEDAHFGQLTAVGGTVAFEDCCIMQTVDIRFPTSIASAEITGRLQAAAAEHGATVENVDVTEPFLMDPGSPIIQALLAAYNEATGEDAEPFTMGGGTYARHFSSAASFGPEMPWAEEPEWVGGMHGPDEGVSEELLKQAFRIYALTIPKLMELDLG